MATPNEVAFAAAELRRQAADVEQRIKTQIGYRDGEWPNGMPADRVESLKRAFDVRIEVLRSVRLSLLNRATRLERGTGRR